jgi:paraquat-inducible protein B
LDEESKQIKRYVEAGVYEAGSIGFRVYGSRKRRADRSEKTPFETVNELTPTELYEFSVVKIPANPEAIRKAYQREVEAKQKGLLEEGDNIMEVKAGAVLSQKNKQNLIDAKEKIEKVLASAESEKSEQVTEQVTEQVEEIKRYSLKEWNKLNTKRITLKEYNQLLNKEGRNAR